MENSQLQLESEAAKQSEMPLFYGVYSYSGFDIISLLAKVVHRKNPLVNLGPIDLSSSFVVASAKDFDFPIVYVSQTFETLTGYKSDEIIGKNCRFLQSPDGIVERGAQREFSDNSVIYKLKTSIDLFQECQYMNINFKKNGNPFVNLITIVPVVEDDGDINYFIGFQVDVQHQAKDILLKLDDGSYVFDNQRKLNESSVKTAANKSIRHCGASKVNDSVAFKSSENGFLKRLTKKSGKKHIFSGDWVVGACPDMLLMLSSRGIILYTSKNALEYLQYQDSELVGQKLNELVYPGDMIQLMREMKGYKVQEPLCFTIRIKHKYEGFVWFSIIGHKTQLPNSKKTKSFVLVGRKVSINLGTSSFLLQAAQTISTSRAIATDMWARSSKNGHFLFITLNSAPIFGESNECVGKRTLYDYVLNEFHALVYDCLESTQESTVAVQVKLSKTSNITVEISFFPDGETWILRIKYQGSDGKLEGSLVNCLAMDGSGDTSIQYEVNQLKMQNKRLCDEVKRMGRIGGGSVL